ncbi:hypothetical protein J6590_099424 [Homalodisca vitripennis]|nr:hypothetical protein J6590_099424 [Homalodisca vitripennis]
MMNHKVSPSRCTDHKCIMWRLSDFWKCDVTLGTPPLENAQEALTALTVFLPFPGPLSAPIPIPVPWYWMHWRCAW